MTSVFLVRWARCVQWSLVAVIVSVAMGLEWVRGEVEQAAETRDEEREALAVFNSLIGDWRGVGQPRRGSTQGAWQEQATWVWDFSDDSVALRYAIENGKLLESARLTYDAPSKLYQLVGVTPDGTRRHYRGQFQDRRLILDSNASVGDDHYRLTVTLLNEKRTLVLYEQRDAARQSYSRVAEVGYTREGTRLARPGGGQPECIVTGGTGTIAVTFRGQTYYVCCSGCKQAFEADPAGIIAEAAKRRQQEEAP